MTIKKRSFGDYMRILFTGIAMGAADVVPGVSGGTIAFITGIYDELLNSLSRCNPSLLPMLFKRGFKAVWQEINGNFLVALFTGILLSIKTFAALIAYLLEQYPILVWAFFFGLIVSSIPLLVKQQKNWRWKHWFACAAGALIVYGIAIATPAQLPGHWWIMFFAGFIAICAMILPGVSGSFLLLLAGLYPVFINAINDLNLPLLAAFGVGCMLGLMTFSKVLTWLLNHHHALTLSVLIGFLVGSLYVTWPWKQTVSSYTDRHGELVPLVQQNVLPTEFEMLTGGDPMLLTSMICVFFGIILVLSTEFLSGLSGKRHQ